MALLVIGSHRAQEFFDEARRAAPDRDIRIWPEAGNPEDIRYALAWQPEPGALAAYPNLELIVSVGAGVDHLFRDPELPKSATIVRYVDADLTARMVQYVTLHTLFHARRMCEFLAQQRDSNWKYHAEPMPGEIRVGIMGIGVLGQACAGSLMSLGYQLRGWSRSPKTIPGMATFAGDEGLAPFLADTDILVVLLPLTPDTRGILDRPLFQKLSQQGRHDRLPGPVLINAGRGGLQVEQDILAALDANELYAASLDVFETEPLPSDNPLWQHPRIVLTPHNAAESNPVSIVRYCLRQIERVERGESPENIVDPAMGY